MENRCRLYFLLVFVVYLFAIQGCKKDEEANSVSELPFIVKTVEDMKLLKSVDFYLNAENLTTLPEATDGACGVGTFKIDFSKYIDSKYYNAEAESWMWVPVWNPVIAEISDPVATDTITLAKGNNVIDTILFLGATHAGIEGVEYTYELVYNTLREVKGNNYQFDLNILQKGSATEGALAQKEKIYMAFDLNEFFESYNVPEKADTFNVAVKYCSGWTSDGLYKYDSVKISPTVIIP